MLLVLPVDSYCLYMRIGTLNERIDYCLCATVSQLRNSFKSAKISAIQWTYEVQNIADALARRNLATYQLVNMTIVSKMVKESTF